MVSRVNTSLVRSIAAANSGPVRDSQESLLARVIRAVKTFFNALTETKSLHPALYGRKITLLPGNREQVRNHISRSESRGAYNAVVEAEALHSVCTAAHSGMIVDDIRTVLNTMQEITSLTQPTVRRGVDEYRSLQQASNRFLKAFRSLRTAHEKKQLNTEEWNAIFEKAKPYIELAKQFEKMPVSSLAASSREGTMTRGSVSPHQPVQFSSRVPSHLRHLWVVRPSFKH